MSDLDIQPIPKKADMLPMRLDRIELREDTHRRSLRAFFEHSDSGKEAIRTLSWEPLTDQYHFAGETSSKAVITRVLATWESMLNPADFELMRKQLGLVEGVREELEGTFLRVL